MFDYVRKLKLAASDTGRRVGLKAAAAVVGLVAAGFLIAAFWTLLADTFDLGSLWASVIVFVVFLVIAAILWSMSNTVKHPVPSTDELKREVEARASLAAEAGLEMAKTKAREVVDLADNRIHSLLDAASEKAAGLVDSAEAKVQGFTRGAMVDAADKVGLNQERMDDLAELATNVRQSRATPVIGVAGALALGLALASRFGRRDDYDDFDYAYDYDAEDWDEEPYV